MNNFTKYVLDLVARMLTKKLERVHLLCNFIRLLLMVDRPLYLRLRYVVVVVCISHAVPYIGTCRLAPLLMLCGLIYFLKRKKAQAVVYPL